jgi:uncharacterized protein (DUF2062 family)
MPPATATKPTSSFWRRRLVEPIGRQLTQGVSPEKIALTLAAGSAAALFPILGTTTVFCLILAIALKLNQPIVQGINVLCNFIWLPVVVGCIRLGEVIAGASPSRPDLTAMWAMFRQHPGEFFHRFGATMAHAVFGWAAAAPIWIAAVYFLTLPALRTMARRIEARRAPKPA